MLISLGSLKFRLCYEKWVLIPSNDIEDITENTMSSVVFGKYVKIMHDFFVVTDDQTNFSSPVAKSDVSEL
jgi:hypothetical protein